MAGYVVLGMGFGILLESKGFGSGAGRTEFYVMKVRPADRLFPVLTTALFLGGAALNRLLLP